MQNNNIPRYHPDLEVQTENSKISQKEILEKINTLDVESFSQKIQEQITSLKEKIYILGDNIPSSVLHFIEQIQTKKTPSAISTDTIKKILS